MSNPPVTRMTLLFLLLSKNYEDHKYTHDVTCVKVNHLDTDVNIAYLGG